MFSFFSAENVNTGDVLIGSHVTTTFFDIFPSGHSGCLISDIFFSSFMLFRPEFPQYTIHWRKKNPQPNNNIIIVYFHSLSGPV